MKQQIIAVMALMVMSALVVGATIKVSQVSAEKSNTGSPSVTQDQPESSSDKPDATDDKSQDTSITSSVRISDTKEVDEATETKQLQSLAKISESEAKTAAEKSAGGTATSVKLENENGNVLYAVTVGDKEVKVDAGNGSVLQVEAVDTNDTSGQNDKAD